MGLAAKPPAENFEIRNFYGNISEMIDSSNRLALSPALPELSRGRVFQLSDRVKFTLSTSYTYLDARDTAEDKRLENRSRHSATLRLSYDDHEDYGWSSELWDTWKGSYAFDGDTYSYHLLNLSLTKHWGKDFSLHLGMYNMLNKEIDELYVGHRVWFGGVEYRM